MESNLYHFSLKDYLTFKQIKVQFANFEINEGEICLLSYFYTHSKSLLLSEIIKESCKNFDSVLLFDMNFSVDIECIENHNLKVLRYEIFNACELLMYLKSLYSFIKDSKMRPVVVIDSWNTYLMGDGFRGELLSGMVEKKCWETVFKLNEKLMCTFLICKKVNSTQGVVNTQVGKFGLIHFEEIQSVKQFGLLDAKFSEDGNTLYHALIDNQLLKLSIFVYPFKWLLSENLSEIDES